MVLPFTPGLDEGVSQISVGARAKIKIPPELGHVYVPSPALSSMLCPTVPTVERHFAHRVRFCPELCLFPAA